MYKNVLRKILRKFRERESYVSRNVRFQMQEFCSRLLSCDFVSLDDFEVLYHRVLLESFAVWGESCIQDHPPYKVREVLQFQQVIQGS